MSKTKQTLPSYNPADASSKEGFFNYYKETLFADLSVCLPAQIVEYDRMTNRAKVQPLIQAVAVGGQSLARPSLSNVPVHTCGGGGYAASFPLQPGDLGWIIVSDADISLFKQSLALSIPNTKRKHQPEDCFFLPDVFSRITVSSEDAGRAVWQTLDGSNKISMGTDDIKVTTKRWEINASESVKFDTPQLSMTGTLNVAGLITATAGMVSNAVITATDFIAGALSFISHIHGGVQPGPGTTGGPQ